jgi:Flp pilus assembly protein TadG
MFAKIRRFLSRDRGQVIMMVVLFAPILLGMTGMAVDLAGYAADRRDLQNAADAIALASAKELPNGSNANSVAQTYATRNNIDWSNVSLTLDTNTAGSTNPSVTVQISRSHKFNFLKVLGITRSNVGARAKAIKASFGGGTGIVPWSVTQATVDNSPPGTLITMKYDATGVNTGNFGAIRIDGPGASTYNTSVMYGASSVACAVTAPNCSAGSCPGQYPNVCAETAPECDGPECDPQTGNMVGPTRTGVDFRMNNTLASCDTFAEVFSGPDGSGKYQLNANCNPWADGPGKCTTPTSLCSRRVIVIPVIDHFGNGSSDPVTIQRFALVFLEGYDSGKCSGNACQIKGRFVNAEVNANGLAGYYDANAQIHFTRLTE